MNESDRRKYPRVDTANLVNCCSLDENGAEVDHCMARAVNVSPVGMKIELFQEFESDCIQLVSVDPDGNLIQIQGCVAHRCKTEDGRYELGISFDGTELDNTRFTLNMIGGSHKAEPSFVMVKGRTDEDRERRKYPRVNANNLISYSCLDDDGNPLDRCMARAVDINPLGAKIEAYQEILSETIQLTSSDVDGNLIDIVGRIAHARKTEQGRYEFGISFMGTEAENTDFALKLIDVCHMVEPSFVMVKRA
jgi:hypothetical protein